MYICNLNITTIVLLIACYSINSSVRYPHEVEANDEVLQIINAINNNYFINCERSKLSTYYSFVLTLPPEVTVYVVIT